MSDPVQKAETAALSGFGKFKAWIGAHPAWVAIGIIVIAALLILRLVFKAV